MYLSLRHDEIAVLFLEPHCDLWIRIVCTLTLLIPLISTFLVKEKIKQTSDKYYLPTIPPDYFFKIWIIMFLLFIFIMIYAAIQNCWSLHIWISMAVINLSCGVWAFSYTSAILALVNVSVVCQIINLAAVEIVWIQLGSIEKNGLAGTGMGSFIRNSIAFCSGWFIAAAALGLFIVLVYTFGLSLNKQLIMFWIAAPLVYLAFLFYNITVIGTFNQSIGLLISMLWAVAGALIASVKSDSSRQAK